MARLIEDSKDFQTNIWKIQKMLGADFMKALEDKRTIEIMLNPDETLWVERLGEEMRLIGRIKASESLSALKAVAYLLGQELNAEKPLLEGEFPLDGSRFAGQIPPVVSAPAFAIRKHASAVFTLDQYVESGVMTNNQKEFICELVSQKRNILICGGTGSGKTTLTNAVIDQIVKNEPLERMIIIEDTGELQCSAQNRVNFHTTAEVTLAKLLKTSLRMRPDRLIVGEVRDHVALDMLDGWNTGHEGGVATLHANNAQDALMRLESLVKRNEFAPRDIQEIIKKIVHCVVFIAKTADRKRKVKQVLVQHKTEDGQYQFIKK